MACFVPAIPFFSDGHSGRRAKKPQRGRRVKAGTHWHERCFAWFVTEGAEAFTRRFLARKLDSRRWSGLAGFLA